MALVCSFAAAQVRAAPVGFGGYVGSSLVDSTFSGERETSQVLHTKPPAATCFLPLPWVLLVRIHTLY